ncbi:hypothetical protein MHYP_G00303540 [Metynnis hypsauchen]
MQQALKPVLESFLPPSWQCAEAKVHKLVVTELTRAPRTGRKASERECWKDFLQTPPPECLDPAVILSQKLDITLAASLPSDRRLPYSLK